MAAWLGWAFDGLDGYLYIMVAGRFVTRLLQNESGLAPAPSEVSSKAAIIQGVFLIGWAMGGAIFGRIGDRIGRARTLTLTVLTYAVFTGLSFFAETWWHLLIFRFISALGIGGEWAAGCALVNETIDRRHRIWASAALQSGYMIGCIIASLSAKFLSHYDPKWVFLIGVAPALVTLWIRRAVPEPETWAKEAATTKPPPITALFRAGLARTTILISTLTSIALITVWAFLYFAPAAAKAVPQISTWTEPQKQSFSSNVAIFYFLVNIAANFVATFIASRIGYRRTFAIYLLGAAGSFLIGFASQPSETGIYVATGFAAFFSLGLFGLFPFYIPPLFPTLVRTLGAGFTYNFGRVFSAVGAFGGGWIAAHAGGPSAAIWWTGFLYLPGIALAFMLPEVDKAARHEPANE